MGQRVITVHVGGYTQVRNGKTVHVSGYSYTRIVNVSDEDPDDEEDEDEDEDDETGSDDNGDTEEDEEEFVVEHFDEFMKTWKNKWAGDKQCVKLVQKALPEVGATKTWGPGIGIQGPHQPSIKTGTAIATFDEKGNYKSKKGESHAGLFMGYGRERGKDGIYLFDQFAGKGGSAGKRFYAFKTGNTNGKYPAETFSVIQKK